MKCVVAGAVVALLALPAGSAAASARAEPHFHWADGRDPALPLSPLTWDKRPQAAARNALRQGGGKLGVTAATAEAAELRELHDLGHGPIVARFQQKHGGLDVFGARVNVVMDRDYRPVAYGGGFVKLPPAQSAPARFALDPAHATRAALRDLARGSKAPAWTLLEQPRFDRMYHAGTGGLVPAYRLVIRAAQADGMESLAYGYLVSAVDGAILLRKNLVAHESFAYRAYADATTPYQPFDGPLGNARTPFQGASPLDEPPRVPVAASLVTLQNGPISTGDPWLDAAATTTSGNNVLAQSDRFEQDEFADSPAPLTAAGTFDYAATADGSSDTDAARNAGIVNMFFVVNWLHDFWYDHGFDEGAGNAQLDNFGRGGIGNDRIRAESQDPVIRDNASMFTPPDGQSPVMQMGLWEGPASLQVTAPALGTFKVGIARFGDEEFDTSGELAAVNDGTGVVTDGCEAFSGVSGMIALIEHASACGATVKARNAQAAGAIGALIVQDAGTFGAPPELFGNDLSVTIPLLSVSFANGEQLKDALGGGTVTVTMLRGPARDSALDNAIIAHEHFHHVSSRLVNDGFGLSNTQGAGLDEGWADFGAMMLVVRPEDQALAGNAAWGGKYSIGAYVKSSAYFGLRRFPYSIDFAVNPLTFRHIQDGEPLPRTAPRNPVASGPNSERHNTGEIWASMLWEVYAALLNDPRHTFDEARARMQDYVIAGLKALPESPTFVEARDGILAAAQATDAQDYEVVGAAFARRGIGFGAIAPPRDSTDNVGVTESYDAVNYPPLANAGPNRSVTELALVRLAGTASDRNGDALTYAWARIAGPDITLLGANTLSPTFTAPSASANSAVTLRLTVDDGIVSVSDDVIVSIRRRSAGGSGAFGGELALAGLLALLRHAFARQALKIVQ